MKINKNNQVLILTFRKQLKNKLIQKLKENILNFWFNQKITKHYVILLLNITNIKLFKKEVRNV